MANDKAVFPTKGYVLSVSDDSKNRPEHGNKGFENGMSIFFSLSDGSFLVVDGGQGNDTVSADAEHLYRRLREKADENGVEDIVVSAWVFTHSHGDHTCFIRRFLPDYCDRVTVREFWFNPVGNCDWMLSRLATFYPDTPVVALKAGEERQLADVKVEVLLTPEAIEEFEPKAFALDYNNSSLILRLHIDGKTVLLTGDASEQAMAYLNAHFDAEDLKCDVLQVPHHGFFKSRNRNNESWRRDKMYSDDQTIAAYAKIAPSVALFPCGELHFRAVSELDAGYPRNGGFHRFTSNSTISLLNQRSLKKVIVAGWYDRARPETAVCQCFFPIEK
jgi:hypothetical protein